MSFALAFLCLALIPTLALTLSERTSSYCVTFVFSRFTLRAALGVSALRARRRVRSSFARYVIYAPKGQLLSAQGRGPERQRRDGTLGMRVPAFYVRPVRAATYPLRFIQLPLQGAG